MARRSIKVEALAQRADLDVELTLIALWELGIQHVESGQDRLNYSDRRKAEVALGAAGSHQRKVTFWLDSLGMDRASFVEYLAEFGIQLDANAQTLPKGALHKLRSASRPPALPTQGPPARQASGASTAEILVPPPELPSDQGAEFTYLNSDDVIAIHSLLEEDFAAADDPIVPRGYRSRDLLDGAVDRPAMTYGGVRKYTTIQLAAAALLHGLVHNHPFHNGNKRTALVAALVFLDRNNKVMESDQIELFQWMVRVAAHELLATDRRYQSATDHEVVEIARWIDRHARSVRRDERSIPWRALERVLRNYHCEIQRDRGEKVRITRALEVPRRRFIFSSVEREVLTSFYINTGDGREVPKTVVKRIRQELRLDEAHGIDSEAFYVSQREPDYFITEYSKTLQRLARV